MEPDVIRMYSSSPPPMDDGGEEEDSESGDFGPFSSVPNSISFTEFETPTTFNQTQALSATSPPELVNNRGVVGFSHSSSNGTHGPANDLAKANGVVPAGHLGSGPSERTETIKVISGSPDFSVSNRAGGEPADCNGGGPEVLTNGFSTFDVQGSPSSQNSVHSHLQGLSAEDSGGAALRSPEDDFADFAAFSNADGHLSQAAADDSEEPTGGSWTVQQGTPSEDTVRDSNRTGPGSPGSDSAPADRGSRPEADSPQDVAFAQERSASETVCTHRPAALNGVHVADGGGSKDAAGCGENDLLAEGPAETGQSDGKGSGNDTETETETETSFGRPLSTDALEEYGDMSTTGSVPSPPLQGDTATPGDHSQLAEDDEDFGDFGDAGSFGGQGFADFDQLDVPQEQSGSRDSDLAPDAPNADDDFGDFNSPKFHSGENDEEDVGKFADFPPSDSFGNFSAAAEGAGGEADAGWSAFGEQQQVEGESWAAFGAEQQQEEEEGGEEEWPEGGPPAVSEEADRTDRQVSQSQTREGEQEVHPVTSCSLLTSCCVCRRRCRADWRSCFRAASLRPPSPRWRTRFCP